MNKIELPEEYIEELQEKIRKENNLQYNELKSLNKMREFYTNYGGILSEKQFICLILGVPSYNYYQLTGGTTKESYIFANNAEENYEIIRRKVITENNLHYDDEINYKKLKKLHQKYAPKMREYIFADKILDINQGNLDNIRNDKKHKTHILLSEPLPKEDELLELKEKIIKKYKLHRRDDINYEKFRRFYNKFGGVMPEDMFAESILDLKKTSLKKIKYNLNEHTKILLRTYMSREKIKEFKQKVRISNAIYPGKAITYEEFEELYNAYNHTLTKTEFSNIILRIHTEKLRKLREKEVPEVCVGIERCKNDKEGLSLEIMNNIEKCVKSELNIEQIAAALFIPLDVAENYWKETAMRRKIPLKSLKKKRKKITDFENLTFQTLEDKIRSILDGYVYNPKNVKIVQEYIKRCMNEFEKGRLQEDKLDILEESIAFSQSGTKSLEFFTKLCIKFQKYERAHRVINDNIDNEPVTKEERLVLRKLQTYLKHAMDRSKAVELLLEGETNIKRIQKLTGISDLEAIRLNRNFLTKNTSNLGIAFGE